MQNICMENEILTYRSKQTERGNEALKLLSVSLHESHFSTGRDGAPDLVYQGEGIEVKRVEFMSRARFNEGEEFRVHIGTMYLEHTSWNWLKEWCNQNNKIPSLIIVLTWGRQHPIFVKFSQEQIDKMQQEQLKNKSIHLNSWDALLQGEILK